MSGIAFLTDTLAAGKADVIIGDPLAADLAAVCLINLRAFAVGADVHLLVGWSILTMPFKDRPRHLEDRPAFCTDQHSGSSSGTSMYYPQSQPLPSRKSLQGHLLSGFLSYLHGQ